jgi:hypothetical protein
MTSDILNEWLTKDNANLKVSNQYFHHHAFEIITTHSEYQNKLITLLNNKIKIQPRLKVTKTITSPAIKANELNSEIRRLLMEKSDEKLKFEVFEERGVFYFSSTKNSIGGFDFAIINDKKNLVALRNLCFGEVHYHNGKDRWKNFLSKNPELNEVASKIEIEEGFDLEYKKTEGDPPLLVGEIQFGNWALVYRDFFKVLKANVQNSVDCLVYIVPDGKLVTYLSDGIVTFADSKLILEEFAKVISVPVWLIGLDISL